MTSSSRAAVNFERIASGPSPSVKMKACSSASSGKPDRNCDLAVLELAGFFGSVVEEGFDTTGVSASAGAKSDFDLSAGSKAGCSASLIPGISCRGTHDSSPSYHAQ